ncbi:MAG: PorT family protein [Flavobacterium sp.]|nr:PorT family protein [Flavobacterium sp.]
MKKTIFSIVAIATFSFTTAQQKERGTFEITPKIGSSSFAQYDGEEFSEYNSGIEFGITADYYFNNRWSLRSGLIAYKMGGKDKTNFYVLEDKLNYLGIPVNANWHFGSTRKWNLNFGLSPSFLTKATENETGKFEEVNSKYINSFQIGFTYGIGYKIEINKKFGILIDAQFFNGLSKAYKYNTFETTNGGYSYNIGGVIHL